METVVERFMSKIKHFGDGCWEWSASINNHGYGQFKFNKKMVKAHRMSYEIAHGSIPKDLCVLHSCDNRLCVNPEHLRIGTKQDNSRDAVSRGRIVSSNRYKTSCPYGHNAYFQTKNFGRQCRICNRDTQRRLRLRR